MLKKRANQLTSDCSYFMDTIPRQQLVGMTTTGQTCRQWKALRESGKGPRRILHHHGALHDGDAFQHISSRY
ncbi:hypothetical protein PRIC1_009566 [Phytophthora ramorum]